MPFCTINVFAIVCTKRTIARASSSSFIVDEPRQWSDQSQSSTYRESIIVRSTIIIIGRPEKRFRLLFTHSFPMPLHNAICRRWQRAYPDQARHLRAPHPRRPSRDFPDGSPARSTCTCVVVIGAGEVLPRKAERKPGCGERPPWPVGPSQTVRRTGRCRGRSPSCCRRRQLRHRRRQLPHHLRPCTASRRPHAPTDLGNPGCTEKMRKTRGLFYRT